VRFRFWQVFLSSYSASLTGYGTYLVHPVHNSATETRFVRGRSLLFTVEYATSSLHSAHHSLVLEEPASDRACRARIGSQQRFFDPSGLELPLQFLISFWLRISPPDQIAFFSSNYLLLDLIF